MSTKVRKQLYIERDQELTLKRLGEQLGISEAEIIRQAIDRQISLLKSPRLDLSAWDKEREFVRSLIARGPVPGGRTWRREDLYDR